MGFKSLHDKSGFYDANGNLLVSDPQVLAAITALISASGGSLAIGTEDGTTTGTQHVFVNNVKNMIMDSHDRISTITYLDVSDKKLRRIDKIEYTSPTFPGVTARKQFTYTLIGTEYILTNTGDWSLV